MRKINCSGGMKVGLEREDLEICLKIILINKISTSINYGSENGNGEVNLSHV